MDSGAVPGPRIVAEIDLLPTEDGGIGFEITDRNRSLIFVFCSPESGVNQHGAMFERLMERGLPGTRFLAQIQFFDDLAAIDASVGTSFELWLGRTVGRGTVRERIYDL